MELRTQLPKVLSKWEGLQRILSINTSNVIRYACSPLRASHRLIEHFGCSFLRSSTQCIVDLYFHSALLWLIFYESVATRFTSAVVNSGRSIFKNIGPLSKSFYSVCVCVFLFSVFISKMYNNCYLFHVNYLRRPTSAFANIMGIS